MKKIKITESQYSRMVNLIVETPFDTVMRSTIQVGDIIKISWKDNTNNFKVIDNNNGQVIMDNVDKGSTNINYRYLLVYTSLDGDGLEMRRAHKTKDQKILDDIKLWKTVNIKDVTGIQIVRDGAIIDEVDQIGPKELNTYGKNEKLPDDFKMEVNNVLGTIVEQLRSGRDMKIITNSGDIILYCNEKTGTIFSLEVSVNKVIPMLNKWDTFSLIIKPEKNGSYYEGNSDIVKSSDGGRTMDIKFDVFSADKESQIWINGIDGVDIEEGTEPDEEEKPEENPEEEKEEELPPEELKKYGQDFYNQILNDKDLKQAFYSQPTFWQSFIGELTGKKPAGNGIITVMNIVKKHTQKEILKRFGKKGQVVEIIPTKPVSLIYKEKNKQKSFELGNVRPTEFRIGFDKLIAKIFLEVSLPNDPNFTLRIIIGDKTDTQDIRECEIYIGRRISNRFDVISETVKANIRFIKSEGYTPDDELEETN